jgi:hypothetical protein
MSEQPPNGRHYVITVPSHPLSANQRRRATWPQVYRAGKVFRDAVAWQARTLVVGAPPLEHAHVVATLVYKRKPFRDPDSAVISCKELVDGLVCGGILVDDSADHMRLEVRQEVGLARRVELSITEEQEALHDHAD